MEPIVLNGSTLTLETLRQVAYERRPVELEPQALERAAQARQVLFDMAAEGKPVPLHGAKASRCPAQYC